VSDHIKIESIRRVDVKPGETLVIRLPEETFLNPDGLARLRQELEANLPDGVKTLIVKAGVELEVVAQTD
jgi:hypothetical protein